MNSKKQIVVSTRIQDTWGTDDLIFLGEWCKSFQDRHLLQKISYQTLPYHWTSPEKIKNDNDYLSETYESFLRDLSKYLNNFHKVNFSLKFWRILIGPWLLTFISTIWDRWEIIRALVAVYDSNNLCYFKLKCNRNLPPYDYEDSIRKFGNDHWNEKIFSEIMSLNDISSIEVTSNFLSSSDSKSQPRAISLIQSLISRVTKPKKELNLVIYQAYFPPFFSMLLNIFLKQRIRIDGYLNFPLASNRPKSRQLSHLPKLEEKYESDFEIFFQSKLLEHIPFTYLEDFELLIQAAKRIPKANNILTANAHFGNELFKVWSALNCEQGSNLIISSHGGAIYPKYSVFDHQEKIANKRIIWGKAWLPNQITLPPNKLTYRGYRPNKAGALSIIDNDSLKYSYRCMSASQGPLVIKSFKMTKLLIEGLENRSIDYMIRPKFSGDNETADRYLHFFGEKRIYPRKWSIKKVIKKSRLVICTYPQTAYAEAMYSGVPTLLVYDSDIWQTQDIYSGLLETLKENKMLFNCTDHALKHIKSIYDDPFRWWESYSVKSAREEFMDCCITSTDKKLFSWLNFLK